MPERLDYPISGTVTESWAPSVSPIYGDFVNEKDLALVTSESAGGEIYSQGAARWKYLLRRAFENVSESDRADYENFRGVVGGNFCKFTDERGVPWRVKFVDGKFAFRDAFRDNWQIAHGLRALLAPHPSLKKITNTLRRDLLFYAPLTANLSSFSRWDGAAVFTRNSIGTYLDVATGLVKTATANVARFEANGVLIEGARTNTCLRSEEFDNAAWVKTTMTAAPDDTGTLDPAGGNTAELLTATAANGTIIQDLGTIASASKVFSVYLKRKTGTGNVQITLDNGTGWTTVTINSSTWTRVTKVQTLANPDVGIRIVTSGDQVWAWGAQHEDGAAFASSYIPTTTAAVARPADDLRFPELGHVLPAAGAAMIVCEVMAIDAAADAYQFLDAAVVGGVNGVEIVSDANAARARAFSGASTVASLTGGGAFVAGTQKKTGLAWQANDFRLVVDGAEVATDSSGAAPVSMHGTSIFLGQRSDGTRRLFGHLRELMVFVRGLTSAEMIAIQGGL